jgi:hypothetical protein
LAIVSSEYLQPSCGEACLVVEAKRLGMPLSDVEEALAEHWKRLDASGERSKR